MITKIWGTHQEKLHTTAKISPALTFVYLLCLVCSSIIFCVCYYYYFGGFLCRYQKAVISSWFVLWIVFIASCWACTSFYLSRQLMSRLKMEFSCIGHVWLVVSCVGACVRAFTCRLRGKFLNNVISSSVFVVGLHRKWSRPPHASVWSSFPAAFRSSLLVRNTFPLNYMSSLWRFDEAIGFKPVILVDEAILSAFPLTNVCRGSVFDLFCLFLCCGNWASTMNSYIACLGV